MLGTSRKHLGNIFKEKIFKKFLDENVAFVLKVYLIIANVDLLANSSNHEVMFQGHSRNVPQIRIFCFKNIPRISLEYYKVMKILLEIRNFKKLFCGLSSENFNIGSLLSCNIFLNFIETVLHLE